MTAAFHPHQALVIAGLAHDEHDAHEGGFANLIPELQEHADLIAAYAATHVTIAANNEACEWNPSRIDVPNTELDALADGVTITGPITCDTEDLIPALHIGTSLLFDAFPDTHIIVRLEYPDGFADKLTLTSREPQGRLALDAAPPSTIPAPTVPEMAPVATSRTATVIGWGIIAFIALAAGAMVYRMNMASPKE